MGIELKAGTAKRDITPPQNYSGTLVFGESCLGIVSPIHARAIVLNDGATRFVIVNYDLNCLDVATPILRERCEDQLGITPDRLALLATHNHNAPIQIAHDNFAYGRWLAESIFAMIQEAIANERGPVELAFGAGAFPWVRCMGSCPLDTEVQVLRITHGGRVLAALYNQAAHPLLGASRYIEPGHPGYASDYLEAVFPESMMLYVDACGANQFPLELPGTEEAMAKSKQYAKALAEEVARVLNGPMQDVTGPILSTMKTISLPLADPPSREETAELMADLQRDFIRVPYPHDDRMTNWIRVLNHYYEHNKPFPKRLDALVCTDDGFLVDDIGDGRRYPCRYEEALIAKLGGLAFVCMQGEICAPIGMRIKDAFRSYFPIMVNAYFGEHNLYIPTRELVRQQSYQEATLRTQYACPVGWHEDVEDVMSDTMIRHIREFHTDLPTEEFDMDHLAVRLR